MPSFKGAAAGAALGAGFGGIGAIAGGILGGLGLFGGDDPPEARPVDWVDVNDPRYYMDKLKENAFGQDIAKQDLTRYGFQGTWQKYLESDALRRKDKARQDILRMAKDVTPGQQSFVAGTSAQGAQGRTSNILGKLQRDSALGKATEQGLMAYNQQAGAIDASLTQMSTLNEQLRSRSMENLLGAIRTQTTGEIGINQANTQMYNNLNQQLTAIKTGNEQRRLGQATAGWQSDQSFMNNIFGLGAYGLMNGGLGGFLGGGGSGSMLGGSGGYQFGGSQFPNTGVGSYTGQNLVNGRLPF